VRHHHVAEDHVNRLLFEQGQSGIATLGFEADETQGFAHGNAQLANALLVVDNQQSNAKVFPAQSSSVHSGFA
jgi:hypothetical protein